MNTQHFKLQTIDGADYGCTVYAGKQAALEACARIAKQTEGEVYLLPVKCAKPKAEPKPKPAPKAKPESFADLKARARKVMSDDTIRQWGSGKLNCRATFERALEVYHSERITNQRNTVGYLAMYSTMADAKRVVANCIKGKH